MKKFIVLSLAIGLLTAVSYASPAEKGDPPKAALEKVSYEKCDVQLNEIPVLVVYEHMPAPVTPVLYTASCSDLQVLKDDHPVFDDTGELLAIVIQLERSEQPDQHYPPDKPGKEISRQICINDPPGN